MRQHTSEEARHDRGRRERTQKAEGCEVADVLGCADCEDVHIVGNAKVRCNVRGWEICQGGSWMLDITDLDLRALYKHSKDLFMFIQ